jgi:type IV pilus assembly protein PilM
MPGMMPGGGMMGGAGGKMTDAEARAKLKIMMRTDFLIQFVWVPVKPEDQPKTREDFVAKVNELDKQMREAEKNNPAVSLPKPEEIEAASLRQSQQIDSALSKAASSPAPGVAGGGAPGGAPAPAGAAPAPAGPAAGGTPPAPK